MFGLSHLSRRLVESVVGLFALLGFLYVPLGKHTGYEHTRAVLSTPAASAALAELSETALSLRQRAFDFFAGRVSAPARLQPEPEAPKPRATGKLPRPVPPKLK